MMMQIQVWSPVEKVKEVENAFLLNGCYGLQTVARENKPKNLHNYLLFSLLQNKY